MKVKFRFGIKSYSGTLDELTYANYEDRNVVIGRMMPENRELTAQNVSLGSKLVKVGVFYKVIADGFKDDLKAYTKKMYELNAFDGKLRGSHWSTFVKMMWKASQDADSPVDLESLSIDDLNLGSYNKIASVKVAIDNGYLPVVPGYEDFTSTITV